MLASRVRTALLRARRLLSMVALPLSIIISSAALAAEDAPAGGADEQPQRPAIILAQKLILWRNTQASYTSVTWDEAVGRLRLLRSKGPVRPEFLFTNGCYADEQRHDQFRQKIFEIYGELFEPTGITIGSVAPRASRRFDALQSAADLQGDPARQISGRIVAPDGARPAADAQVILLPPNDPLPVAIVAAQLRDPDSEYFVPADENGSFVIEPLDDEYLVAVLHDTGYLVIKGPLKNQQQLQLLPWATVTLTDTGADDQSASIYSSPLAPDTQHTQCCVYSVKAKDQPVPISVPAGEIRVFTMIELEGGRSLGSATKSFTLKPGEEQILHLPTLTAEQRDQLIKQFPRP